MTVLRATPLRLYPTAAQARQLARSVGAARWVYNWTLSLWRGWSAARAIAVGLRGLHGATAEHEAACKAAYGLIGLHWRHAPECTRVRCRCGRTAHLAAHVYEPAPSAPTMSAMLTQLKAGRGVAWDRDLYRVVGESTDTQLTHPDWLGEVSSYMLREAIGDVDAAFKRFFRVLGKHARGDHSECGVRRTGGCAIGEPQYRSSDEPTTRRCHCCGVVRETEPPYGPIGESRWTCGGCGAQLERESNAAQNLRNYPGRKPGADAGGSHRRKRGGSNAPA